jgi:serine/threonine protein kinase
VRALDIGMKGSHTKMISPDTALAGRYRLLSRLGSGGHGEVWRARDTLLDRVVAVKMIRAGLESRRSPRRSKRRTKPASCTGTSSLATS